MIRFPVWKSVSSVLSHVLLSVCFGSWHRFDELCGYPIIHNSLFSLCTQSAHAWFTAAFRLFIPRMSGKRSSHHGSGSVLIVDSSIPGWLHVGTCGHWVGRLLVLWILEFWLRTSRRVDTTMEQVVANLQQQLSSQQQAVQQLSTMLENQQASSAEREKMRCKLSCRTCWIAGTGMLQMLR